MTIIKKSILNSFPVTPEITGPRGSQAEVLKAIQKAFEDGYKNILLDCPVGSGKSAIAVACAKFYGDTHILTPRKSLQDQYTEDFVHSENLVQMRGRSSYPCTYRSSDNEAEYQSIVTKLEAGKVVVPIGGQQTCSEGPCLTNSAAKLACTGSFRNNIGETEETHPCPYHVAIDVAQKSDIIVHNVHSFIFQTYYAGRFEKRPLSVVDECHEIEGILRGFAEKKVTLPLHIKDEDMPDLESMKTMNDWVSWLSPFSEKFSTRARAGGEPSQQEEFLALVQDMEDLSEYFGEKFVVAVERDIIAKRSKFVFTPEYVGNLLNTYITNYGDKRIFMSGTIYSKELYCKLSGLNPAETCYIKIGSSFPKALRPIYMKPEYMVDTSHKLWDNNFAKMIANIRKVMETFHDVKGLIHAPSYHAGAVIANALRDTKRIVIHDKDNFQSTLQDFYASKGNEVFLSPVCQQGVDFKGDRARFQIILRVPYPNTSDAFMAKMVKTQFAYYNYQALIVFGQQIGRVNRSETDFGVTILMDERFEKFIGKNRNTLPRWLTEAIIIK